LSVLWNPDLAADIYQGSISYTCAPGSLAGTGNVNLTDSPFDVVGSGADAEYYLSSDSVCLDVVDGEWQAYANLPAWPTMTTQSDGSPDTGYPDMGHHWPIP
jgi:hypothetical protein